MPSKVYVINEPLKKDAATGAMAKWLPMESAAAFGEVVEVLPPGSPPAALDGYVAILRERLKDFREDDYLVLVGDQSLLVAAAAIVGWSDAGKLRVLKWSRNANAYEPLLLNFGSAP
jgi:hypothetical protein